MGKCDGKKNQNVGKYRDGNRIGLSMGMASRYYFCDTKMNRHGMEKHILQVIGIMKMKKLYSAD